MKKMRLAAEQLRVESFAMGDAVELRGTVDARAATLACTPRCGTVARGETCYSGCTAEVCEPTFDC
ncbi:MAG TPA: hypothetical protein VF771_09995 [Longimicrobiaceae bacterium]